MTTLLHVLIGAFAGYVLALVMTELQRRSNIKKNERNSNAKNKVCNVPVQRRVALR